MDEPERIAFRVRATMADGAERLTGLFGSQGEAAAHGRQALAGGAADRVEILVRRDGRWQVVGRIGRPKRWRAADAAADGDDA